MGRVVVVSFISIDGVIQAPLSPDEDRDGGFDHGGWVPPFSDDTVNAFMQKTTTEAAGLLLGRRTYDILSSAWADADASEPAVAAMNRMPKYVVSSRPPRLGWRNSHWAGADLGRTVIELTDSVDGDLVVFGAGMLVRGLAGQDLVDEYRLLLFPLVLGDGKRLFDAHGHVARFTLTDSIVTASGVAILSWTRDRHVRPERAASNEPSRPG